MGIGVFFEEQNLDSLTADSEMLIGFHSVMAQSESENISANVRWGIQQRMRNGTYAFRFNLLGYRKSADGEPEIVPEEAEIIRKIFDMYAEGGSTNQIKNYLESHHFLTKTGKEIWDKKIIRDILSNEKYVGDLLMQKTFRTDCISKKVRVNNGEMPKYLISNNHPAIIDRETFNFVQAERARRASKRKIADKTITENGKYSGKYALSELLICGECGSPYRRRVSDSHGKRRVYWRCLNRIEHGTKYCKKSMGVEECKLHEAICRALNKNLPDRDDILNAVRCTLSYAVTNDSEIMNTYNIELNIKQLKQEANDLMTLALTTEGNTEKYEQALAETYEKIKVLREQLEIAKAKSENYNNSNLELQRIMNLFENQDLCFDKFDDVIIRRIVECIKVMSDKKIVIILKGGFEITEKLE